MSDPSKLLQSGSSSFPLLQDLNFGSSYGLKLNYIKSQSVNPASAGFLRLGYDQNVSWRNNSNSGDLSLNLDGSDNLQFNSTKIPLSGAIVNADINGSAAIDISKINNLQSSLNALNPMTTAGDLIRGTASGTPERLAIGAAGSLLRSNGTTAAWDSSLSIDASGNAVLASAGNKSLSVYGSTAGNTSTLNIGNASTAGISALNIIGDASTNGLRIVRGAGLNAITEILHYGTGLFGITCPSATSIVFATTNTERMRIDSSGNVLVTGSGVLGYGTGSGGTVTQLTSKATNVTIHKPSGKITTHNASLSANTRVTFVVFNNSIGENDVVILGQDSNHIGAYFLTVDNIQAGAFAITIWNVTGGSLSDAIIINFVIIKGATS